MPSIEHLRPAMSGEGTGREMVRVKICGIRSLDEALTAVAAGADALGFVFVQSSKRSISPSQVAAVCGRLPGFISRVGVFADAPVQQVAEIAAAARLTVVQLHGDEDPAAFQGYCLPVVKALRVPVNGMTKGLLGQTADLLQAWQGVAQGIILDACANGQFGGSGQAVPWREPLVQELFRLVKGYGFPLILAGGLHPGNVQEAIRIVRPYAVDVSSGVEAGGCKNSVLMHDFVSTVRAASGA